MTVFFNRSVARTIDFRCGDVGYVPQTSRHVYRRQREYEEHRVVGTGTVGEPQMATFSDLTPQPYSETPYSEYGICY
jgi:hypothetical protein